MKSSISYEFEGKSIETESTKWSEFPNGGKFNVEQILRSEKILNPNDQDSESNS